MSGTPLLDWTILAVSVFNAVLLAWLGLTVLLNSDRRRWGIWFAGGGMLLGAVFFISHTALLSQGLINLRWETLIFWWSLVLLSAVTLPFLWYIIMLWYTGYWEDDQSALHRRHQVWLVLTSLLLFLGIISIISAEFSLGIDSPRFGSWFLFLRHSDSGIPLLVIGFSSYMLLSIILSLDVLRNPGPSSRAMGDLARRRAHPWLVSATVMLFLVAVIVAATLFWVGQQSRQLLLGDVYQMLRLPLSILDLIVSLLISTVILLWGQAIVAYEIFTGKTLPRRGLRRQWHRALLLAAGISVLLSTSLTVSARPVYSLLLLALLMIAFFALVSWRSNLERNRVIESLRPLVTREGLYGQLLNSANIHEIDFSPPFAALCQEILGAQSAYLVAVGSLSTLVSTPLAYPRQEALQFSMIPSLVHQFNPQRQEALMIDPHQYRGANWAVPLWSERGLSGLLLLGNKRDGGIYSQEEIEIGAIIAERLIDTQAGVEIARRLMLLQRQNMIQTQVIDQQTRRVLHDEVLPDIHAALISLAGASLPDASSDDDLIALLGGTHHKISNLLHEMPETSNPDVERLGLWSALHSTVNQEYAAAFDNVSWSLEDSLAARIRQLPSMPATVIYYAAREAIRNAASHGRMEETDRPFVLNIRACEPTNRELLSLSQAGELHIIIEDNGRGFAIKTAQENNDGQGLALHSTMMAIIGGVLSKSSDPGGFTRITLAFPE